MELSVFRLFDRLDKIGERGIEGAGKIASMLLINYLLPLAIFYNECSLNVYKEVGMSIFSEVVEILQSVLQLEPGSTDLAPETGLLGEVPEFDSMAVVTVLTALEENYGFFIDDDEVDAETFETVGSLVRFVEEKL